MLVQMMGLSALADVSTSVALSVSSEETSTVHSAFDLTKFFGTHCPIEAGDAGRISGYWSHY